MKSSKSLSHQATNYFIGRAIALGLHFIVPIILVRIFVKSDFGQFAQLLLIYEFLFRVLQFGLRQSVFYFIPQNSNTKPFYISNTFVVFALAGILTFIFLTFFKIEIAGLFNASDIAVLLPLCGLHIFLMLVSSPLEPIFISEKKAEIASLIVIGSQIIRGFFIIAFVLIYNTVFSAVLGLVFYSAMRFLFYSTYVYKYIGFKFTFDSWKYLKEQFQYAMPIGFSGLISNIYKKIDKFILSIFFSPEIFAIYRIGNFKIPFIQLLFQSVGEVTLPRAVEMLKEKQNDEFLALWRRLLTVFSYVGIGSFFLFQVIASDVITFMFTEEYASSVPIFRIFLFLILGEMTQYGIVLRSIGKTRAIFKSNLIAFVVSVPATFFLVQAYGPIGAASAAILGFMLNVIAQLAFTLKELNTKVFDFFPVATMLKITFTAMCVAILLFFIQDIIEYKLFRILFSGLTFTILFVLICWKTKIYNIFDEKFFKRIIKKFS